MGTTLDRLELRYEASPSTSMLATAAPNEERDSSRDSPIVVINRNQLYSDTIARSINESARTGVLAFSSVESWLERRDAPAALVLIYVSGLTKDAEAQQLDLLLSSVGDALPVVVLGDRAA